MRDNSVEFHGENKMPGDDFIIVGLISIAVLSIVFLFIQFEYIAFLYSFRPFDYEFLYIHAVWPVSITLYFLYVFDWRKQGAFDAARKALKIIIVLQLVKYLLTIIGLGLGKSIGLVGASALIFINVSANFFSLIFFLLLLYKFWSKKTGAMLICMFVFSFLFFEVVKIRNAEECYALNKDYLIKLCGHRISE